MSEVHLIHHYTDAVHSVTDRAEGGLNLFLDKLADLHDSGWSPNTLPMMHLANDARTLRALADRIDAEREKLIGSKARDHAAA